jgi:flagellin
VAAVRELIYGNIAGIRHSLKEANSTISMVQTLDAAAGSISEKLSQMKTLAEQVINGLYSDRDKAKMQEKLQQLGKEANNIAKNTTYNGNKLLTDDGETVLASLGDNTNIRIFAKDLRIDTTGLDLTTDATGVLGSVREMIKNVSEHTAHLNRQAERLEEAMMTIELQYGKILDIEWSDFDTTSAEKIVINAAGRMLDDEAAVLDIQANVTPKAVKRLLDYEAGA